MMMCDVSCALPCGTELPNLDGVGWHDVGAWVWGPAAADIATTFIERWNALYSPTPESALYLDLPSNAGADGAADYTRLDDAPAAPADTASNVAVQTVRTSPCEQGGQFPFAPSGELTVLHAQLKAIRRVRLQTCPSSSSASSFFVSPPPLKRVPPPTSPLLALV